MKFLRGAQVDLQPRTGGALAGVSIESAVAAVAADLAARMPDVFELRRARAAAAAASAASWEAAGGEGPAGAVLLPTWVALLQELERWNVVRWNPSLRVQTVFQQPTLDACVASCGAASDEATWLVSRPQCYCAP